MFPYKGFFYPWSSYVQMTCNYAKMSLSLQKKNWTFYLFFFISRANKKKKELMDMEAVPFLFSSFL